MMMHNSCAESNLSAHRWNDIDRMAVNLKLNATIRGNWSCQQINASKGIIMPDKVFWILMEYDWITILKDFNWHIKSQCKTLCYWSSQYWHTFTHVIYSSWELRICYAIHIGSILWRWFKRWHIDSMQHTLQMFIAITSLRARSLQSWAAKSQKPSTI